jgi:hypothetical protein
MAELPLTQGRTALVDAADLPALAAWKWTWLPNKRMGYAVRWISKDAQRQTVYLHRWLLGAETGQYVDHINGNGLDNQRANLRLSVATENLANRVAPARTIPFRGVYRTGSARLPWVAQIKAFRRNFRLGGFAEMTAAALAYDRAALHFFGSFARLNFPDAIEATRQLPLAPSIQRMLTRDTATQLALPLALDDDFDFPAPTATRPDWYEIAQLRRWRATAATLIAPADLARLDECLEGGFDA